MTKTQERVLKVLERITTAVQKDADDAEAFSDYLDVMLDDLHGEDFFGTEGQLDPRGDFRDDNWSMKRVQGVDPGIHDL